MLVLQFPTPCSMGGARITSRRSSVAFFILALSLATSFSRVSVAPFSANSLTPSDTMEPTLKRGAESEEWEYPAYNSPYYRYNKLIISVADIKKIQNHRYDKDKE